MNQSNGNGSEITDADFPALFRAADHASKNGQRIYLRLYKLDLITLVIGALLIAFSIQVPFIVQIVRFLGATLLAVSLVLTFVMSTKGYKQQWYGGRAAAESVKSLAWRYMTGAEPFVRSLSEREVDRQFSNSLHEILEQSDQLSVALGGVMAGQPQITESMRHVRSLPPKERKHVYIKGRITDQQKWYSNKSGVNAALETKFFALAIGAQALALLYAIFLVARPTTPLDLTGVFSTAAASLLAWMQVKQHQELAQSYAVAAHELGLICDQSKHIGSDDEFSVFVADAEAAISREHTLWIARRDRLPRTSSQRTT